jgi:hypothetical protein
MLGRPGKTLPLDRWKDSQVTMTFHRKEGDRCSMAEGQMLCFNRRMQKVFPKNPSCMGLAGKA